MNSSTSRRKFLYANSVALLATQLPAAGQTGGSSATAEKLAKDGGPKTVKAKPGKWVRWDDRERQQLSASVDQSSLSYWQGRTNNKQTALFIERFKAYCPTEYVLTCSSGTAAVHIAIAAAGIGPGDEVITTPVTDIGTISGILFQQGVPVFADLGAATYNLDPKSVERCITPRTKAIIAVHLAGTPTDLAPLQALAEKHGLVLIEDCAQAWGAKYRGRPVGSIAHIGCYSMMSGKHIGVGEGGVVVSNDKRFGPALLKYCDKGNDRFGAGFTWDKTAVLATNYRMGELQAAFGAVQLQRVETIAAKRAALGRVLIEGISDIPGVIPPQVDAADRSSFWFFYFRLQLDRLRCKRNEFAEALRAEGALSSAGYIPVPIYKLPYFQRHAFFGDRWPIRELGLTKMDYAQVKCPEAEAMLTTGIQIQLNESMDEALMRETAAAIRKVAKHFAV